MYGGEHVYRILSDVYSGMLMHSYIPHKMKTGVIVNCIKAVKNAKPIQFIIGQLQLTFSLLKLLERIICTRIENDNVLNISNLQGGFQKQIGCLMTSFLLKEAIYYAKEKKQQIIRVFFRCQKSLR